jgi:tetratricopeptide (TPR) repeat protein
MLAFGLPSNAQVAADRETAASAAEQAGQFRLALDDYVAALMALPEPPPVDADRRLRERIIKVALQLIPSPVVSDEAQQRLTSGQAAAKSAQTPKELVAAAAEFQGALRIAPWLAAGYSDLGNVQEKLRDYPAAIQSFELYLLAAPSAQDAQSVQKRVRDLRCRFPAMYLQTHSIFTQSELRPAWALSPGGELTVSDGSVEFRDPGDLKHSFAFQVAELRSLERRHGPEGFPALRMKLQNGKNYDLVPDVLGHSIATQDKSSRDALQKALGESMDAMEKAIRDMASQQGLVLK